MSMGDNMFEDPRHARRKAQQKLEASHTGNTIDIGTDEHDWYLKRKPVVKFIGPKNESMLAEQSLDKPQEG